MVFLQKLNDFVCVCPSELGVRRDPLVFRNAFWQLHKNTGCLLNLLCSPLLRLEAISLSLSSRYCSWKYLEPHNICKCLFLSQAKLCFSLTRDTVGWDFFTWRGFTCMQMLFAGFLIAGLIFIALRVFRVCACIMWFTWKHCMWLGREAKGYLFQI